MVNGTAKHWEGFLVKEFLVEPSGTLLDKDTYIEFAVTFIKNCDLCWVSPREELSAYASQPEKKIKFSIGRGKSKHSFIRWGIRIIFLIWFMELNNNFLGNFKIKLEKIQAILKQSNMRKCCEIPNIRAVHFKLQYKSWTIINAYTS